MMAKMARDMLAVPASCCSVGRMFSVFGRFATWQRSHLRESTLSDLMMYKEAMNLNDAAPKLEEEDLPEWEQEWCKRKLRRKVRSEIIDGLREDNK